MVSNSQGSADLEEPPYVHFERRFAQEFELDAQRSEALRVILKHYERDRQRIEEDHIAATYRDMEPELHRVGVYYAHLIRDKVLPTKADRARYDELSAGSPSLASVHPTPNR